MRTLSYRERAKRLAQLEQAAEHHATATGPLTDDDRAMLCQQHALGNVAVSDGQATRRWRTGSAEYTQALDTALARLNVATDADTSALRTALASDPPHWNGCVFCGNCNDPRQQPCPWCGAINGGHFPPDWRYRPTVCVCPACGDTHDQAARLPSDWNRVGACPACAYVPPPASGPLTAWAMAMGLTNEEQQ